jgi:hypothetical protein
MLFILFLQLTGWESPDNSVDTATGLRAGRPRNQGSAAAIVSVCSGYQGCFPGSVKLAERLSAKVRMLICTSTPHMSS